MPATCIVGAQWGDEGKGKISDFLAGWAKAVARYNGGANSGHTVVARKKTFKLHLIPSGLLRKGINLIVGNGMVLDPEVLAQEIKLVQTINPSASIFISDRAHVVMPYHKVFDGGLETKREGKKIGTTSRGIGPTYADKMHRSEAIRVFDLISTDFKDKLAWILLQKKEDLKKFGLKPNGNYLEQLTRRYRHWAKVIKPYVCDTTIVINELIDNNETIVLEGAQGTLLDIDHGTFPYVSSSNGTAGGACTGLGISPTKIKKVIGVAKAYTTRVGKGPFPTELFGKKAEHIREAGNEYGTTTGRPRRCGWLDLPMLAYAHRINNFTELAITKLDILNGFPKIKVCVAYKKGNNGDSPFAPEISVMGKLIPVYKEFEGWKNLSLYRTKNKGKRALPKNARKYLRFIEDYLGVPIKIVSYGPDRNQTISS